MVKVKRTSASSAEDIMFVWKSFFRLWPTHGDNIDVFLYSGLFCVWLMLCKAVTLAVGWGLLLALISQPALNSARLWQNIRLARHSLHLPPLITNHYPDQYALWGLRLTTGCSMRTPFPLYSMRLQGCHTCVSANIGLLTAEESRPAGVELPWPALMAR